MDIFVCRRLELRVMFRAFDTDLKATGIPKGGTLVVLQMPGNKVISFDRLVGACVEMSKLSSDSQANDSAGDDDLLPKIGHPLGLSQNFCDEILNGGEGDCSGYCGDSWFR
jgi:hypothetical protein